VRKIRVGVAPTELLESEIQIAETDTDRDVSPIVVFARAKGRVAQPTLHLIDSGPYLAHLAFDLRWFLLRTSSLSSLVDAMAQVPRMLK